MELQPADYGARLQTKQPFDPRHMRRRKTFCSDEGYWWVRVGFRCEEVGFVESDAVLRTTLFNRGRGNGHFQCTSSEGSLGRVDVHSDDSSRHNHVRALLP